MKTRAVLPAMCLSILLVHPGLNETAGGLHDNDQGGFAPERSAVAMVADSLPLDFPPIRIDTVNNPAPGRVFFANFGPVSGTGAYGNYLMILDNAGKPVAYKKVSPAATTFAYNFTTQPNGLVSYVERTLTSSTVFVMDTSFKVVDRHQGGNGYSGDIVDFRMLPNGHAMIMLYDWQIIDVSKTVPGGNPAANVCETVIQGLDLSKNVVFQWRSLDYIPITDAYVDSLAATIDYMHSNGFEFDKDGGILLSSRHLSEITKIDGKTGEIVWRLGGKRNQFTFIGEREANRPNFFSFQHDISRLANGNILLFDNGNQHASQHSRVAEYRLDEVNKTATLVWEYRHTPDIFSSANGSAQRLPNGNTLIGWGNAGLSGLASVTEVHADKSLAFEFTVPKGQRSWRAYRFPWKESSTVASYSRYDLLEGNSYPFNGATADQRTGVRISFSVLKPIFYNGATVAKYATASLAPMFSGRPPQTASTRFAITKYGMTSVNADVSFDASLLYDIPDPRLVKVYRRDSVGTGAFLALPTLYNDAKNEIVATTSEFGEFIFGWNGTDSLARPPTMIVPPDRDSVNHLLPVTFGWNPRGHVTGYDLQVATDSLFRSLVINDSLLTASSDTLNSVLPRAKYFWRIRARNYAQTSSWSNVWSFTSTVPYISVSSPNNREVWKRGYQYFIRWISNLKERVRIDLFRGTGRLSTIKDSVPNIGAYTWSIPLAITTDTTYRIRITSVADSTLFAMSSGSFSINSGSTGIAEKPSQIPAEFGLNQNYPNPFNPTTAISFQLSAVSLASLRVYDVLGREIASLVDEVRPAGTYTVHWDGRGAPSGVYYYRLRASEASTGSARGFVETKRMILLR